MTVSNVDGQVKGAVGRYVVLLCRRPMWPMKPVTIVVMLSSLLIGQFCFKLGVNLTGAITASIFIT